MELLTNLSHELLYSSILYVYLSIAFIYLLISISTYNLLPRRLPIPNLKISLIASYGIIINYIFVLIIYATHSNFFDHAEANIATVSWLFQIGKPIYHELQSAERYTIPYGPTLYIINGFFLNLFNPSIFSAKIGGILAGGLSLLLIFYTLKNLVGSKISTFCLAYISLNFIAIYVYFAAATFWNRSDSFLLMFVALALFAVVRTNSPIAILLITLSVGISINLKIHGVLYFLPIYILLYFRHGIYATLVSVLGSSILAMAPFISLQQVSLKNYILWLSEFGKQGISFTLFKGNIVWSIYLFAPVVLILVYLANYHKNDFYIFIKKHNIFLLSLLTSLVIVAFIGSKAGAGMNHLIPFLPLVYYSFALVLKLIINLNQATRARKINKYYYCAYISLVLALLTVTALRGVLNEIHLIHLANKYNNEPAQEIQEIIKMYPGFTIGMGYGGDYDLTYYRPLLVYEGNPYLIDAVSVMDAEYLGKKIPNETLKALKSCQIKLWLIPKGGSPFQLDNYFNHRQVFNQEFKNTFLSNYDRREESTYYDLWLCKKSKSN
ncbi:glycosyltransferase family 39 protein [Allocoleopsis sp.]|uniref:glycosyltransferase family 39 protein n=1 Tax=Allocoleopsis sp. TaxID=3088169 RepID=UPI002FD0E813